METREFDVDEAGLDHDLARPTGGASQIDVREPTKGRGALLVAALVCGLAIAAVAVVSLDIARAVRLDAEGFDGFLFLRNVTALGIPAVTVAQDAVDSVNPIAFLVLLLLLGIVTSQRGQPLTMVAIVVVLAGSVLSSLALKSAIGGNSAAVFGVAIVGGQSFPSDHAAASMALVLCLLLAAPREWGGLIAGVGGLYVLLVGYGSILLQGHLPSDVVGGYLMAGLWALLALSGLRAVEAREGSSHTGRQPRLSPTVALSSVFALAVIGTVLAAALGRHQPSPRAFVGSTLGIALVAVVLIYVFARLSSCSTRATDPAGGPD